MSKPAWYACGVAIVVCLASAYWAWRGFRGAAPPITKEASATTTAVAPDIHATFLILPPEIPPDQHKHAAAVTLFCDLLAQHLSQAPGVSVVDRTNVERILAERATKPEQAPPLRGYDAMVRVAIDSATPNPTVVVTVVDLSLGNIRARQSWPWQTSPEEATLSGAAAMCVSAGKAIPADKNRQKVRVIHIPAADRTARLDPLANDLVAALSTELSRTSTLCVVQHLEAASAKEEALFLMMGLSRLSDGRQFLPQADLSLELRLTEHDAIGKTFEQTPVKLECTLRWANRKETAFALASGLAGDAGTLVRDLHAQLARHIGGLSVTNQEDLALRRSQAQAELRRADIWDKPAVYALEAAPLKNLAEIAATAAKLDPSYEEAAYQAARMQFLYLMKSGGDAVSALQQVSGFLRRSDAKATHRRELLKQVESRLRMDRWVSDPYAATRKPPPYECGYWQPGKKARRDAVMALREVVTAAVETSAERCPHLDCVPLIAVTYFGMLDSGVAPAEARQWRDRANASAVDRLISLVNEIDRRGGKPQTYYTVVEQGLEVTWMALCGHLSAAMYCAESTAGLPAARKLFEDFLAKVKPPAHSASSWDYELYKWPDRFNDETLKARYRALKAPPVAQTARAPADVSPLRIVWPMPPYDLKLGGPIPQVADRTHYALKQKAKGELLWQPLAQIGSKVYVLAGVNTGADPPRMLGTIDLKEIRVDRKTDVPLGLIQPVASFEKTGETVQFSCFARGSTRLLLGSLQHGLLSYDPQADSWSRIGPKEGLPLTQVNGVGALGGDLFLCSGKEFTPDPDHRGKDQQVQALYTVDVVSGQVKLLHRLTGLARQQALGRVVLTWQTGKTWNALTEHRLIRDVLSEKPAIGPWLSAPSPWLHRVDGPDADGQIFSAARIEGGILVHSWRGLVLLDDDAKNPRLVRGGLGSGLRPVSGPAGCLDNIGQGSSEYPVHGNYKLLSGTGDLGVFEKGSQVYLYSAKEQKWHGPVECSGTQQSQAIAAIGTFVQTDGTLILGGRILKRPDILAAAEKAGYVFTEEQSREWQVKRLTAKMDRDAACMAFMLGEFEMARARLASLLAKDPENAELLMLSGILQDRPFLDNPTEALRVYQRLAGHKNPSARLRGLRLTYFTTFREGQIEEAARIQDTLREEFYADVPANTRYYFLPLEKKIAQAMKKTP